jgi:secondary thiamine-phosphate synthase enzyme
MTETFQRTLGLRAVSRGLHEITGEVARVVGESGIDGGMCNVFLQHTSASLCINENADPTARADLEAFLDKLVPEDLPYFRHTHEGPDDMPSHIKNVLTETSLAIPVSGGRLALGTWQGIYLWEHRDRASGRRVMVTVW